MNKLFTRSFLSLSVAAASVLTLAPQVKAQALLEEVIVTAQKREQSLQDVPVAVTAFTGEMLEKSGVKDMFDLQVNAPSLIVGQTQTSTTTTFSIRGVFTSSQNFGLEPSVGLYVDSVYRARQSSMINNLVDIAAVEVLRGPQGTLFGRNTPAGAIQINTAPADFEGTGFLEGTVGDYDLWSVNGAKSFTVIEDVLAVRATGFIMQRDGFVDWVKQGRVEEDAMVDRDRWGARLQALYLPTDELSVRFIVDRSEVDEVCCSSGSFKNNFMSQEAPEGTAPFIGTDTNIAAIGGTVLDQDDFYDYRISTSQLPVSTNEDTGVSLRVDYDINDFTLSSITAYREFESFDDADIAFNDLDGAYRINDAEQEQFTQEFQLTYAGESVNYVVGLFYYDQKLENSRQTNVGADLSAMLGLPANAFIGGDGSDDFNSQDHTSYAVFGQADYNLTDNLILTAGLRWTYEEKDLVNIFTDDAPPVGPPLGFDDNWGFYLFPPLAPQDDIDEDFDDDQVTGTIKLSWFMTEDIMLYGSYGTGYKSGGTNADRIPPEVEVLFDAENSESFELGMKAEFPDQALRVNLALHKTDTDDLQTISFQGGGFALINAGVAETWGGELDLSWLPTESTTVTLGYAYNNGEYADFEQGPCQTSTPWHRAQSEDPNTDEEGFCDVSGGDLAGNPENVIVSTINQGFELSDGLTGYGYLEVIYTDDRMTDVNNDPAKADGSYTLVNLRTGLIYEPWNAQVTLWGRNITDEDATNTIADAPGQTGRLTAYYQEPFTWGLTLRKDF